MQVENIVNQNFKNIMIQKYSYSQADINARVANISRFSNSIHIIGRQLGVDPAILEALIAVESSGNPNAGAGRTTGAKGLMQIIKQTWEGTINAFPTVKFKGTELRNFYNRDLNDAWADADLNILIGTLTLILKARSLTKMTGISITADDPADAAMLFTSYNAGEYTVTKAYQRAVAGGSRNPEWDFLDAPYLKGAINDVVNRFNLSWNVDGKYKEISEYAGRVLTFLDLFKGKTTYTKPTVAVETTNTTTTTINNSINQNTDKYTIVSGDTGYKIAQKLGVTFSDLQKANSGINWSRLSIGQRLNVPTKGNFAKPVNPEPVKPTQPKTYRVQSGETLSVISRKFGISIDALKNANTSQLRRWGTVEGFAAGALITIPVA